MTYHTRAHNHREGDLVCHWCGTRKKVPPACPECGSEHLGYVGYGTQRVEEELSSLFPSARILRMDADTTATKASYDLMLSKFRRHEADILLGTQMVTKGHDFPGVTLVGVLLADSSLYVDDYRAGERTFAMLTQVIGRAGRADLPGHAVIQTSNPDSEIIRLACAQDFPSFYNQEIRLRRLLCFPPACDVALLTVSGPLEADVLQGARRLHQELESLRATPAFSGVELIPFGPFEAPVYRVDNRYRMRMVIKCRLNKPTLNLFHTLLCVYGSGVGKKLTLSIDLNPSNL
jgi:primosomal protein N' (replication factor Y)